MSILVLLAFLCPAAAFAQDGPPGADPAEITPRTRAAIEKGLRYLSRLQGPSGSLRGTRVPVAATSLAGLAFLADGSTPARGPYSENIRRAIRYLLRCSHRSGYISEPGGGLGGGSGMYGNGFATLFLAECMGMIEDPALYERVSNAVRRAVRLIESCQNRFGGWNMTPNGAATDDGSGAIAIMQITALRAARNAGIKVSQRVIERARKYVLEMTNADGWYQYNYHSRGNHRSSGLTGPGMYMLGALGLYDHEKYRKGIQNLMKNAPFLAGRRMSGDRGWSSWYYYTLFFCSLAIFQKGGREWKRWYPAMRKELLHRQNADGSFQGEAYGGLYSAFAILALELPHRVLPFFQEGGRGREGH